MTSSSNWVNDSSTLSVSRPVLVVVLKACVTETKDTAFASNASTILAKSASEREVVDLVDDHHFHLLRRDVGEQALEPPA